MGAAMGGFLMQQANNAMDAAVWNNIKNDAAEGTARDLTHLNKQIGRENAVLQNDMMVKNWHDLNYEAQRKHMENAGLNVGLMYGGSGGGGGTVSSPTIQAQGSSGASGAAEGGQSGAMMVGAQAKLIDAQTKVAEAQAANIEADTANKPKVGLNLDANTNLQTMQAGIAKVAKEVSEDTKVDQTVKIQAEAGKVQGEMNKAIADGTISQETVKTQISQMKAELVGTYLKNQLTMAGIKYTEAQTKAIADQVTVAYMNAYSSQKSAGAAETNAATNLMKQIKDATYQNGILELGDRKLDQEAAMGIMKILTGK